MARGPYNGYDDEQRQIAAAVFDWNARAGAREWETDESAHRLASKRAAFIAKWTNPSNPATTTKTNRKANPNHQPKGA